MEQFKSRRRHSAQFKAEVLSACAQPGASVASVALSFGLNANLVGQWRRGRGMRRAGRLQALGGSGGLGSETANKFVALSLAETTAADRPESASALPPRVEIRVELRRGALLVALSWPLAGSADCAALLRELLR